LGSTWNQAVLIYEGSIVAFAWSDWGNTEKVVIIGFRAENIKYGAGLFNHYTVNLGTTLR